MSARQVIASISVVEPAGLNQFRRAWERLAETAIAPNVFYEPWMLLPAVEKLDESENLHFLLVHGPAESQEEAPLWALFPLQVQTRCLHLPLKTLVLWQHRYCYLTAPLIDRDHVDDALDAFWRWFEVNPFGCHILDTNYLLCDGPFHAAWANCLMGRCTLVLNEHPRGLQTRAASYESYVRNQLSKKRLHALTRSRRHLEELGTLVCRQVDTLDEVPAWIEQFLQLESSGWKGEQGTAIAQRSNDAKYFREITYAAAAERRATLLSLELDGEPIAMKHVLTAGDGSFVFKIAYDEEYARFSPGVLLELEHLERHHSAPGTNWSDSGAAPRHPLFDMVSNERRIIRRTLISKGSSRGDFWVSALPLFRWLRHRFGPQSHGKSPSFAGAGAKA